ncbi:type II toxin-antitoxin system YafQ family toxin [Nevskia ramosa]|uniref:type II toxin-antitoxin system YafQ family toxin n=1 Tax=Nevskia ramosa TaxID=64002 RepID=UPI0023573D04
MTSKPGKKRAPLPLRSDYTKQFKKDWERLTHSGRYDMQALKEAMALIVANKGDLPAGYRDHELAGDWADHRECHVGGDFLLIYLLPSKESVVFVRAGTHSELFG